MEDLRPHTSMKRQLNLFDNGKTPYDRCDRQALAASFSVKGCSEGRNVVNPGKIPSVIVILIHLYRGVVNTQLSIHEG